MTTNLSKAVFRVREMDCAEETSALRAALSPVAGVGELSFDILNGKMTVGYDSTMVNLKTIEDAATTTGLKVEPWREADSEADHTDGSRLRRTIFTAVSGAFLALGYGDHLIERGWEEVLSEGGEAGVPWPARVLYLLSTCFGVWFILPRALAALKRRRPDINLLMTVAVIGAIAIGEYLEAAVVSFLFAVSLSLESWSIARARRAIAALMSLAPETASVIDASGTEAQVPAAKVLVGSRVIVRPGEKFPLDGRVVKGSSSVNQAPITGESLPVTKGTGDDVFAGTINEEGALEVETTKLAADTTLSKIIQMVGDAQSKRSPSEQWVEKFARYYTPIVFLAAIAMILVAPLVFQAEWSAWIYRGLVLLVIACPCALVISTPVSIVAALTSAARKGVLVKGGPFIEAPATLNALAVDKTGTLTLGQPEVQNIEPLPGFSDIEVLTKAAALELRSEHPLAKAVLRAAEAEGITAQPAENFQAVKGKGATGQVGGKSYWVGSHRFLDERQLETPELHARIEAAEASGATVIVLGTDTEIVGWITLADAIRPEARAAVQSIRDAGVSRIVMLTGDNRGTGEAIGKLAGVDEVRAELLPDDKVAAIQELVSRYERVGMVGDGVNDAPAMAMSSLGIAMGSIGTDAALETADIALMRDDLSTIAWLIQHSRRTLRVIRQNIFFSLGVKAVFLILTLIGHASLWAAIAADMGASLIVIFNGLRLLQARDAVR